MYFKYQVFSMLPIHLNALILLISLLDQANLINLIDTSATFINFIIPNAVDNSINSETSDIPGDFDTTLSMA